MLVTAKRLPQDNLFDDTGSETLPQESSPSHCGSDFGNGHDLFDRSPLHVAAQVTAPAISPSRKEDIINRALTTLAELAADPKRFAAVLAEAFGPNYDKAAAEHLRQQILTGDRSWMPAVELAPPAEMPGAYGAYAAQNATVYINSDVRSPKRAAEVLIEELGHHIDTLINTRDSAGDEGEIFRRLVVGEHLSDATLAGLRAENDHGTMQVDGQTLQVENWSWGSFFWPFGGGNGTPVPPVIVDVVKQTADNIVHTIAGLPDRIRAAAQGWVDALVANAKAFGADLLKSMETVAGGLGKLARGDLSGINDILNGLKSAALDGASAFARLTMDTISAVQTSLGLEPIGRPLRADEIAALRQVFGDTIDYSKITVKEGNAGIFAGDRAITMGNTIYVKDDHSLSTLIHESTHVWQFQNGGNDYMLKAGWAQFSNWLHGNDTNVAYDWTRDIGKGWAALNPEQQAQLIQDAGTGSPSYIQQLATWNQQEAAYEAKELAYHLKYSSAVGKLGGLAGFGSGLGGVSGGLGGGGQVNFAQILERRALDAEHAKLIASRPIFTHNGMNYTPQIDDALWRLRNRIGAP